MRADRTTFRHPGSPNGPHAVARQRRRASRGPRLEPLQSEGQDGAGSVGAPAGVHFPRRKSTSGPQFPPRRRLPAASANGRTFGVKRRVVEQHGGGHGHQAIWRAGRVHVPVSIGNVHDRGSGASPESARSLCPGPRCAKSVCSAGNPASRSVRRSSGSGCVCANFGIRQLQAAFGSAVAS